MPRRVQQIRVSSLRKVAREDVDLYDFLDGLARIVEGLNTRISVERTDRSQESPDFVTMQPGAQVDAGEYQTGRTNIFDVSLLSPSFPQMRQVPWTVGSFGASTSWTVAATQQVWLPVGTPRFKADLSGTMVPAGYSPLGYEAKLRIKQVEFPQAEKFSQVISTGLQGAPPNPFTLAGSVAIEGPPSGLVDISVMGRLMPGSAQGPNYYVAYILQKGDILDAAHFI